AGTLLGPDPPQRLLDALAQLIADGLGLWPVFGKSVVQNDDIRPELHEPGAHRIELAFGRADQETKDERGARRDHAHGELDHVLSLLAQVVLGEQPLEREANQRSTADARGTDDPDRQGGHRAPTILP